MSWGSAFGNVSAVVPSYNTRAVLRRSLAALGDAIPGAEVVVVDGQSSDGSARAVRDEFPEVTVLEYPNFGWAHATNRGLEVAAGEFLLLLNSDVFVTRGALAHMVQHLVRNPDVGAVAPTLVNEDGTRQRLFGMTYGPNWSRVNRPLEAKVLSGACLLTRREVVDRVGGMDENLFFYNEEYDWCSRVRQAGYGLRVLPPRVVHVGGASTPSDPDFRMEELRGFLYVASKHSWPMATALRVALPPVCAALRRFDPRPAHREMWTRLGREARRRGTITSPFPLSGRGQVFPTRIGAQTQPAPALPVAALASTALTGNAE